MARALKTKQFPAKEIMSMFSPDTSTQRIAEMVGADWHTVMKWKAGDIHINQWFADKYAVRIGLHPSAIWNDWFALEDF